MRFVVASGTDSNNRSNAFTVFTNGDASVSGVLRSGGQPVVTASTFPTYLGNANFALSSGSDRSISVNASSSGAGKNLTIQAGSPANGSDLAGGGLILSGGNSTGSAGSAIEFRTALGDTSGTTLHTVSTRLKINAAGGIEAGEGLSANKAPQFVLGKYNNTATDATTTPPTVRTEGVFVVGAGTMAMPKNAMRVTEDGIILIPRQGDLLMGAFIGGDQP